MTQESDAPETRRLLADDVFTMAVEGLSQPGIWIEAGWPTARTAKLADVGETAVCIWEVTDGVVADIENDECILILSGSGRVRFEDGETIEMSPGRCLRVRAGDRTEWTVLSTVRVVAIAGG